jgi:hypothetical protein
VGTVIHYTPRGNDDRHQRWERLERAQQCERYGARKAQGMSQRQAAKVLDVPRSTLQAWQAYQDRRVCSFSCIWGLSKHQCATPFPCLNL